MTHIAWLLSSTNTKHPLAWFQNSDCLPTSLIWSSVVPIYVCFSRLPGYIYGNQLNKNGVWRWWSRTACYRSTERATLKWLQTDMTLIGQGETEQITNKKKEQDWLNEWSKTKWFSEITERDMDSINKHGWLSWFVTVTLWMQQHRENLCGWLLTVVLIKFTFFAWIYLLRIRSISMSIVQYILEILFFCLSTCVITQNDEIIYKIELAAFCDFVTFSGCSRSSIITDTFVSATVL